MARRLFAMFTVATVSFASPVYLRFIEFPGLPEGLRLIVYLQAIPTVMLMLLDHGMARAGRKWQTVWRIALASVAFVSLVRQAQMVFDAGGKWFDIDYRLLVPIVVAGLLVLAVLTRRSVPAVLVALGPAMAIWTVVWGYYLYSLSPSPGLPPGAAFPHDSGRPIFVLLFDELDPAAIMSSGHIGADWPNFRRLAAESAYVVDATSNYGSTCASVASMLTGRLLREALLTNRACFRGIRGFRTENVLSVLAERRNVRVYSQYLAYCFDARFRCRGITQLQARAPHLALLQHYIPDHLRYATRTETLFGYSWHTFTQSVFDQFLADIRASEAPGSLSFLHLTLPHGPYVFDETGKVQPSRTFRTLGDERRYEQVLREYRQQTRFVDLLLGEFIAKLQREGIYDQAIVIVTSDHGFWPYQAFAEPRLLDAVEINGSRPRVALFIRAPGVRPGPRNFNYQHLEFRSMMIDLVSRENDGEQLLERMKVDASQEKIFCYQGVWYVRRSDRWRSLNDSAHDDRCEEPRVRLTR
jgi:hypothetical protein